MSRRNLTALFVVAALLGCEDYPGGLFGTWPPPVTFTDVVAGLRGLYDSSIAWGDFDADGDLDLALAGYDGGNYISRVYRNDGGTFTDIGAGLTGVRHCSLAWGDYDGDGDLDLALAGRGGGYQAKVYRNDGGTFTAIGAGLTGVEFCSLAWGDYDNDGDLDLVLAGYIGSSPWQISKVYRNDGGTFTDIDAGLTGVANCSLAWGDYDNDGDLDLALGGWPNSDYISKVYRNDGGTFTAIGAGLTGVSACSLAWGDYDNDGYLDLALAGRDNLGDRVGNICRNDGAGTFADIGAGLYGLYNCSLAWGDYDSDGDLDLALSGATGAFPNYVPAGEVYRNDGGMFTDTGAGLTWVGECSLAWGDYDDDGDLDLALAGWSYSVGRLSKVYRNNGVRSNNPPSPPSGLSAVVAGSDVTFSWDAAADTETPTDGLTYNLRVGTASGEEDVMPAMSIIGGATDGKRMVPATGNAQHNLTWTLKGLEVGTYYWSVQAVDTGFAGSKWATEETFDVTEPFTDIGAGLTQVANSSLAWGDYDRDGRMDLAVAGYDGTSGVSTIYRNEGGGTFTDITAGLPGVYLSSVAWADLDNDGDLDMALAGNTGSGSLSRLFRNDGGGTFAEVDPGLPDVDVCALALGDFDNDGYVDLALAGRIAVNTGTSGVHRNNGDWTFTNVSAGLTGVYGASLAWGDHDNDGDLDLAQGGLNFPNETSAVYRNNGDSTFTDIGAGLPGLYVCSIAWGDYDADGDADIAFAGNVPPAGAYDADVFRNNGDGTFTDMDMGLIGVTCASVAWGDYDNDGDLDLVLQGFYNPSNFVTRIYRNDDGALVDSGLRLFPDTGLNQNSSAAWGDFDDDGDLDLALSRCISADGTVQATRIFRNNCVVANTPPAAPSGLSATASGSDVTFSWSAAADAETPVATLTYNLRVGTAPGDDDVMPAMADLTTGKRLVPAMGNVQHNLSWTVKGLAPGTYYWSVQAVDSGLAGSAWAAEQSVTVTEYTYKIVDLTTGSVADAASVPELLTNAEYKTTKLVLKRIGAGSFAMGDEVGGHAASELPVHTVNITQPYYMGVFEVTQRQWAEVAQAPLTQWPSGFVSAPTSTNEKRPVEQVSWEDSQTYLTQLSSLTGATFRLPTEAEWEYACKAGTPWNYSYGNPVDGTYMWYFVNSGGQTHEVGTTANKPNPWGLYDMHGNVWEWCSDWYDANYYSLPPPPDDPQGPGSGTQRVARTGSWFSNDFDCRSSTRGSGIPSAAVDYIALRAVLTP